MTDTARTTVLEPTGTVERSRTYWNLVWRTFRLPWLNRLACVWVVWLLVIAVIVPFVANSAPYTAVIAGRREYPLFHNLTRIDWIILVCAVGAVVYGVAHWRLGKQPGTIEELRVRHTVWMGGVAAVLVVVSVGIAVLQKDYLDSRDYRLLAQSGKIEQAVYAPLRWGFKESEPLEADRIFDYPSRTHLMGTDGNGRDALARLLWSVRIVLGIGLVSETIALIIGVTYGALMGYFLGRVDILGMRLVEMVEAIPLLFLLISFVAIFGREHLFILMAIIGFTGWTGIARFVRAEFLRIRNLDYVSAAKAVGVPLWSVLFRHMLPNGLTPVIVSFTFGVAGAVGSESTLSFLGIGVAPPTPSWGVMLNEAGNPAETFRWWLAIAPGLLIFITVLAYNIIGEGLRDAIDPRTNKVR